MLQVNEGNALSEMMAAAEGNGADYAMSEMQLSLLKNDAGNLKYLCSYIYEITYPFLSISFRDFEFFSVEKIEY